MEEIRDKIKYVWLSISLSLLVTYHFTRDHEKQNNNINLLSVHQSTGTFYNFFFIQLFHPLMNSMNTVLFIEVGTS